MALQNLYLLHYNNYFNRQFKRFDTIEDYEAYQVGETLEATNFNPNDGINATHIINHEWTYDTPDYLVVEDITNKTLSRWFVTDAKRSRKGQYILTLKRDTVADNIDSILDAPMFVERAMLNDDDPLIFNDENINVNQIKTGEFNLLDETRVPWIVAYVPRHNAQNLPSDVQNWETRQINVSPTAGSYNYEFNSIADMEQALGLGIKINTKAKFEIRTKLINDKRLLKFTVNNGQLTSSVTSHTSNNFFGYVGDLNNYNFGRAAYLGMLDDFNEEDYSFYTNLLATYNNKIFKVGSDYYKVEYNLSSEIETEHAIVSTSDMYQDALTYLNDYMSNVTENGTKNSIITCKETYRTIQYTLSAQLPKTTTFTISTSRCETVDAPYDMICMPYKLKDEDNPTIKVSGVDRTYDPDIHMQIAMAMSSTWGGALYDVQVVPYCPVRDLISGFQEISVRIGDINTRYNAILDANNNAVGYVFYCNKSSDSFDIDFGIYDSSDLKIASMTKVHRVCSPNYNGSYEFSPYMNGGVQYFNVDFTYLPYQPWIKLNPNYQYLYGEDFNDSRGLICQGNFSITKMNDAWANYQNQNVNFQAVFDRQIKNMKKNFKYQQIEQLAGGSAEAIGTGASMGALVGSGVGVGLGALSAVGGLADLGLSYAKYKEQRSYAKDMYKYNLQNIQAQPETISQVTAFNYNSKYVPFLEIYTCTEQEIKACEDMIKWNSMSVGRIGTLREYVRDNETFIQGSFIRLNVDDEYNVSTDINDELKKGIYIKESEI